MSKIAVIGAGPMGLACARELLLQGHRVTVYEADAVIGGMSACFDFEGLRIERFYHFICKTDYALFASLRELGIEDQLRWVDTRMGYYHRGRQKDWGTPWALLKFPGLGLSAKLRYGLLALFATRRHRWADLDRLDAVSWMRRWCGEEGWRELWQPLFELKFHHFTPNLSAAWIWARMRRIGQSRRHLLQEQLGHLVGGSDTWLNAIAADIAARGGEVRLHSPVREVVVSGGAVRAVRLAAGEEPCDGVISTMPLPFVSGVMPALPEATRQAYDAIDNIAVVCVLVKMRRALSPYFWMNVSDRHMAIPGVIEYSNLNPLDEHLLYIPYYLPFDHADYQQSNDWFAARSRAYLLRLNTTFSGEDILAIQVGRYRYAQPVCPPGFLQGLPPPDPGIRGLRIADTSCYYPEDRSISASIQLGRQLACDLGAQLDV